ncbi:hypothetical protein [Nostoc sp. DSM 114167]|jgi:hypothetical protein|uniref:hypothetical protein n=1 Tax=Nostoc sp. DSM 114167 TaxID=3439050 RepID=UPI004045B87C
MTVIQQTVHPSTISIPSPLYRIGQRVEWIDGEHPFVCEFTGIVTGQTYRIDCIGGNWRFTMVITNATTAGQLQNHYIGGHYPDVDENRLRACIGMSE